MTAILNHLAYQLLVGFFIGEHLLLNGRGQPSRSRKAKKENVS